MILSIIVIFLTLSLITWFIITAFFDIKKKTDMYRAAGEYNKFYNQLLVYSDEITDLNIKGEYLVFLLSIPISYDGNVDKSYYYSLIDRYKSLVIDRFSNHIPSLKKEIRDIKLEKILK